MVDSITTTLVLKNRPISVRHLFLSRNNNHRQKRNQSLSKKISFQIRNGFEFSPQTETCFGITRRQSRVYGLCRRRLENKSKNGRSLGPWERKRRKLSELRR